MITYTTKFAWEYETVFIDDDTSLQMEALLFENLKDILEGADDDTEQGPV